MKKKVITSIKVEGFHNYPGAPQVCAFLRNSHRHIFHIRCWFDVQDSNREIEFITMANKIASMLNTDFGTPCQFGMMACEHIAEYIINNAKKNALPIPSKVEVLEDGDGGAIVEL